ncbi:unnamed protein product [Euphydryas editha]|uniref:Uncharacterized protein n=1 Tax=Euphydryas editha TaxID=104508 RepID=A0AAU9VAP6_EUPED|nr:unnamed protein product [Euphydryas editha]
MYLQKSRKDGSTPIVPDYLTDTISTQSNAQLTFHLKPIVITPIPIPKKKGRPNSGPLQLHRLYCGSASFVDMGAPLMWRPEQLPRLPSPKSGPGYSDVNSTKRAEQKRRGLTKTSVDINCNKNTIFTVQKEHFLANEKNKTRLIRFLAEKMTAAGIETTVAAGDADSTIVRWGLDKAAVHLTVVIIGEDCCNS